ncbi:RusA family crossover junction endodeoxyribonuclease [uncultured Castellaniella sp.]|uniref:RusA family crossover junction endodeoxyribonuclease n=1 Tax=uncultured Castellaniella sp. TaxID=647907 RepID=UPI002632E10C|nr:RusA family crossover junction endodeoxyribonuclease [uncultured Castellaniella sp.]
MTFHDQPTSMQDLAFPRAGQGRGDTGAIPRAAGTVQFFVPGKPQGKGRPRAVARGKFVRMYTPEKTASYESTVALAASQAMAGRPPIEGPVVATLFIALPIPTSWSKKKQAQALADELLPITKPDSDNVVKAVFDAINGVVWADDTQVVDHTAKKRYRGRPGVSVTISPINAQEAR